MTEGGAGMGIAIHELLSLDYFKDFRVIAGSGGLNREIQGTTVFEAPDAFRWTKGKELILSSGYVLAKEPGCMQNYLREGYLTQMAGMMIKAGRYLNPIPADLIELFEQQNIPLIEMPFSIGYMELMNQINTAVMNKTIKRFRISTAGTYNFGDTSYKERKIKRILQAVEAEMDFPAFLYDLNEAKPFFSSNNFEQIAGARGLQSSDFWAPGFPHTKHTLCDSLGMSRYRIQDEPDPSAPRFSWITVPISFDHSVQAYFVVMESRDLIDYFDEYSIRIAVILLQAVYEQLIVAQSIGNIGFENLIHFAVHHGETAPQQLLLQANALNINLNDPYFFSVLRQKNAALNLADFRENVAAALRIAFRFGTVNFAFLDGNDCLLLLRPSPQVRQTACPDALFESALSELAHLLSKEIPQAELCLGYFRTAGTLQEAVRNIGRCVQALKIGGVVYPDRAMWCYEDLGPLAWLQLTDDEMDMMCREFLPLAKDPRNAELLKTLKTYLACNLNFSLTAEALYVHINTVRKRIERVNDLLKIDWSDSFARMKTELILQLMQV